MFYKWLAFVSYYPQKDCTTKDVIFMSQNAETNIEDNINCVHIQFLRYSFWMSESHTVLSILEAI